MMKNRIRVLAGKANLSPGRRGSRRGFLQTGEGCGPQERFVIEAKMRPGFSMYTLNDLRGCVGSGPGPAGPGSRQQGFRGRLEGHRAATIAPPPPP